MNEKKRGWNNSNTSYFTIFQIPTFHSRHILCCEVASCVWKHSFLRLMCCSTIHSLGRLLEGYLWRHYSDCHRHPLLIAMHHQHLRIFTYLFFHFLPPQLSGMQNSRLLFLAFLFTQHANTPFSSIFVPCLLVQPTVTQPCQHQRNCSSTGAQQAEEGDKEAAFTLVALSNLRWHHSPEDGRRERPVQLKESSLGF